MKSKSTIRLVTLLKLLSDQYGPDERRSVEAKVREDLEARARLEILRDAIASTTRLPAGSAMGEWEDGDVVLQRMAGLLDGTLRPEETVALENECWDSQELLFDVVVLFQSGLCQQTAEGVASQQGLLADRDRVLRERLIDLFPAEPPLTPRINGGKTAFMATTLASAGAMDCRDESAMNRPVVVVPRRVSSKPADNPRFFNSTKIAFAIAFMVALVASTAIVAKWASTFARPNVIVEAPREPETDAKPERGPNVAGTNRVERDDENPEFDPLKQIVDVPAPSDVPRNTERALPNVSVPETENRPLPDALVETDARKSTEKPESPANTDLPPSTRPNRLAWSWDRVEGLVAVRSNDLDVWSGALAKNYATSDIENESKTEPPDAQEIVGMECKVLPLSWAQASVKGLGIWTVPENTDLFVSAISVRPSDHPSLIESRTGMESRPKDGLKDGLKDGAKVVLRSGRLAIADADAGSVVFVETTSGNWRIRINDPESVVIVEHGSSARLIVQKGSVSVNGEELKARQQLVRVRDGGMETMVNRETIKWLKKPEHKFPSRKLADQWMVSRDLFVDLSQPNSISAEDQPMVRAALATIDPPGQAEKYLANVLPEVRAEGIQWMLAYGQDPQRLRQLANELATELNAPGLATTLPRLVVAIHRKRWPPMADAESLVTGLQNRNVSVRRLSHGLLVHLFGTLEVYDSEADAATRALQSLNWLAAINRIYRRLENARRR